MLRSRRIVTIKAASHKFSYLLTYLILIKIILIVPTKCKNFTPKCTKFDFGFLGNLQRSPDPLAGEEGDWLPLPLLEPLSSLCREAAKYVHI